MQFFLLIIEITSFKGNTKKYNNFLLYNNNLNKPKFNFNLCDLYFDKKYYNFYKIFKINSIIY